MSAHFFTPLQGRRYRLPEPALVWRRVRYRRQPGRHFRTQTPVKYATSNRRKPWCSRSNHLTTCAEGTRYPRNDSDLWWVSSSFTKFHGCAWASCCSVDPDATPSVISTHKAGCDARHLFPLLLQPPRHLSNPTRDPKHGA